VEESFFATKNKPSPRLGGMTASFWTQEYQANGVSSGTIWPKIFGLAAMMSPLYR
jgi:hypothetical protein